MSCIAVINVSHWGQMLLRSSGGVCLGGKVDQTTTEQEQSVQDYFCMKPENMTYTISYLEKKKKFIDALDALRCLADTFDLSAECVSLPLQLHLLMMKYLQSCNAPQMCWQPVFVQLRFPLTSLCLLTAQKYTPASSSCKSFTVRAPLSELSLTAEYLV